ncbi:Hypothetical_protein [Hexamita inflata]|uniref:Hypothetical_protein n=1 Tax=Hexamita inflata TaxID=28002 RepID=A0AA86RNC8_9EUKA|nr:Hypothetical protein HINF_LOCUS65381 [Hexamita inflata]
MQSRLERNNNLFGSQLRTLFPHECFLVWNLVVQNGVNRQCSFMQSLSFESCFPRCPDKVFLNQTATRRQNCNLFCLQPSTSLTFQTRGQMQFKSANANTQEQSVELNMIVLHAADQRIAFRWKIGQTRYQLGCDTSNQAVKGFKLNSLNMRDLRLKP